MQVFIVGFASVVEVVWVDIALGAEVRLASEALDSILTHVVCSLFWDLFTKLVLLFEIRSASYNLHDFSTSALDQPKSLDHLLSHNSILFSLELSNLIDKSINYLKCWLYFQFLIIFLYCLINQRFYIFVRSYFSTAVTLYTNSFLVDVVL